ncbi:hypothetical protein RO21_07990 [[Actinobacillus] muris]|uniref:Glycosyltransferase 2-like domain-containing protein n=1 Tax=Muribacter muris TaxID=67855 RepID=A0A0J5P4A2_9PAST|nr:glycosyltransferase [Muribacter muris]KMK51136.1 hypothetical protein RO21_07990 [[Actinobacillus] muris] [Muribacter muris]
MSSSNILISVIVPIYNVEKYLQKCIESIIEQSYTNLEIILVNDGSKDSSPQICDKYAKKDSRIKVIHKENGGLSDARNKGLEVATGDFISFIDSDDFIEKDLYNNFQQILSTYPKLDIYIFNLNKQTKSSWIKCHSVLQSHYTENKTQVLSYIFDLNGVDSYAWNKIFRRSLFQEYNLFFPKGKLYEDVFTIPRIISKSRKIFIDNKVGYNYVFNHSGIMRADFSLRQLDNIQQRELLLNLIKSEYPIIYYKALNKLLDGILSTSYKLSLSNKNNIYNKGLNEIKNYIKTYKKDFLTNSNISIIKKLALCLLIFNIKLYGLTYKIYLNK